MGETSPMGKTVAVLVVGVAAMSSASILIRLCPAPALTVAVYRVTFGSVLVLGAGYLAGEPPFVALAFSRSAFLFTALSGLFLAFHFATWIHSLDFTSVASSVVLVQTSPVFVAILSWPVLRERLHLSQWVGVAVAVAGTVVVTGGDLSGGSEPLKGDLLALAGALAGAGYWICGRQVRKTLNTVTYASLTYATAALLLLGFALVTRTPLGGFTWRTYALLLAIAILPQGLGHTSFNWALKHLSAAAVSVFALGEPVGASLLAYGILHEGLPIQRLVGGMLVLTGVFLVFEGETRQSEVDEDVQGGLPSADLER